MDEIIDVVTRARAGDREAFGLLYDTYVQEVYRFLLAKTRQKEEAQDLTSSTFMKALVNIRSFSPKRSTSFRAWLFTIAHRTFLDAVRSGQRHETPLESNHDIGLPETSTQHTENALLHSALMKALDELSETQRETIILRVWHDCSFQEIAEILGKSEASTKMLMKRGLLALKTMVPPDLLALFLVLIATVRETP